MLAALVPRVWAEGLREWATALWRAPQLLHRMAFARRSLADELVLATQKGSLRRALGRYDLLCLGLGQVIASGLFTQTGVAVQEAG